MNFDSPILKNNATPVNWVDNSTVANWYFQRSPVATPLPLLYDNGSNTAGNAYNYGTNTATDRSLGSMGPTGTTGNYAWGVQLKNNSGNPISDISVSYAGEQWRVSEASDQPISFYYKDTTALNTQLQPGHTNNPNWIHVPALDFYNPISQSVAAAIDGNLSSNRTVFNYIKLPNFTLPSNHYLVLKWDDPNFNGSDHGMSIDDVVIRWVVCATPLAQASFLYCANPGFQSINLQWTNGSGSGRIVVMNTINSFTDPVNGTTPSANPVYAGSGEQIVYNGSGNSLLISGLEPCRQYWFRVYEYSCSGTNSKFIVSTTATNPASITTSSSNSTPTILKSEDFESSGTWPYTVSTVNIGTGGSAGTDVLAIKPGFGYGATKALVKSYSVSNLGGESGTMDTIKFAPVTIPAAATNISLQMRIASYNEAGNTSPDISTGRGNDSGEDLIARFRINGTGAWFTAFTQKGNQNKLFDYTPDWPVTVSYSSSYNCPNNSDGQNYFTVNFPNGTTQVEFILIASNNRVEENWCIDNLILSATTTISSTIPTAYNITGNNVYCSPGPGVDIGLSNSQTGMNYQLYSSCPVANTPIGSPIPGTGSAISFGAQTMNPPGPCTFSVVATNATYGFCSANMLNPITVTISPTPAFTLTSTDPTTCVANDGTLILNGLTPTTNYSINYTFNGTPFGPLSLTSSSGGSILLTNLSAGAYSVSATLAGCTSQMVADTLYNPASPIFSVNSSNPTTCGGNEGSITLNGLNASTSYIINYNFNGNPVSPITQSSNSSGSITITNLTEGTYSGLTVSLLGCVSAPAPTIVLIGPSTPSAPAITTTSTSLCTGQSTTLSGSGCAGTLTWSNGATTSSITVSPGSTTVYTATCTVAGCVSSASSPITITVNSSPSYTAIVPANPTSCGGNDGTITISGLQASTSYEVNYVYNGTNVGPLTISSNTSGILTISGLSAGSYTGITVTLLGCPSVAGSANLSDPGSPTAPSISSTSGTICEGQSIDLTASGCSGGTITWSTGATSTTITVAPGSTTTYTATCSLAGCTSVASNPVTITVNSLPVISSVTSNNPTVCGGNDGSIDLDVVTPNTTYSVDYLFNGAIVPTQNITSSASGIISITGLSAGSYTNITVAQSGCPSLPQSQNLIDPNAPAAPSISATMTSVCIGQSTVLTASGCSGSLQWSTGETTLSVTVSPNVPSTYTVTCTENGCISSPGIENISINPGPVYGVIGVTSPTVCGGTDGSLLLPGLSPSTSYVVNYTINGIPVSKTLSTNAAGDLTVPNLGAGNYTGITVSISGCSSASQSVSISDPNAPAAPVISADNLTLCSGTSTTLTATGCSGNLTWSDGTAGSIYTAYPLSNTTYTATCTVAGCTSLSSNPVNITVHTSPVIVSIDTSGTVNNQNNGFMHAIATGTGLQFSIDNGTSWQPTGIFDNLPANNYTLSIRDSYGCITSQGFIINNSNVSIASLEADTLVVCPGSPVSISVKAEGMSSFGSFEICLTYDETIARFIGLSSVHPALVGATPNSPAPGKLIIQWSGSSNITIPDHDLLFELQFVGISAGTTTILKDNFLPGICGLFDQLGNPHLYIFSGGKATFKSTPQAVATGNTSICEGDPLLLSAQGDTLQHNWTSPDGSSYTLHDLAIDHAALSDSGIYILSALNSVGCYDYDTIPVIIHPLPSVLLANTEVICTEGSYLLDAGPGFNQYDWSDGSSDQTLLTTGEGEFWVRVIDAEGCQDYDTVQLAICPAAIYIPTAFSPNGDGRNDSFHVKLSSPDMAEGFKMLIFNRWGALMFESNNINDGWDGKFKGADCQSGDYIFVIKFHKPSGKTLSQENPIRGTITLIR